MCFPGCLLAADFFRVLIQLLQATHSRAHAILHEAVLAVGTMEFRDCERYTKIPPKSHGNPPAQNHAL